MDQLAQASAELAIHAHTSYGVEGTVEETTCQTSDPKVPLGKRGYGAPGPVLFWVTRPVYDEGAAFK